jgi:hypothetical protein
MSWSCSSTSPSPLATGSLWKYSQYRAELAIGPLVEQGSGAWAGPIGDADIRGDWPSGSRAQDAQPPETQKRRAESIKVGGGCDGHALREIGWP